jgi:aldehyde dehydrogenase (NAD+)
MTIHPLHIDEGMDVTTAIQAKVTAQHAFALGGRAKSIETRRAQLTKLKEILKANETLLFDAVFAT